MRPVASVGLLLGMMVLLVGTAQAQQVERTQNQPALTRQGETSKVRREGEGVRLEHQADTLNVFPQTTAPITSPTEFDTLARGWEYYNLGELIRASEQFERAAKSPDAQTVQEARMGLAYLALKRHENRKACDLLESLVSQGFHLADSLPALLSLLRAQGDKKRYDYYLAWLPPEEAETQRKTFYGEGMRGELAGLGAKPSPASVRRLLAEHSSQAEYCADPDVYFKVSMQLPDPEGMPVLERLRACPSLDPGLRLGVVSELTKRMPLNQAVDLLRREYSQAEPKVRGKLRELELGLSKAELGRLPEGSPSQESLARFILEDFPTDEDSRALLAWRALGREDASAADSFAQLSAEFPSNPDYLVGLGYSLYRQKRLPETLAALEGSQLPKADKLWELYRLVRLGLAAQEQEAVNYQAAETHLAPLLAHDHSDQEARSLLAWVLRGQHRDSEALPLFEEMVRREGSAPAGEQVLTIMRAQGQLGQAFERAKTMGRSDPNLEETAGDFLWRNKAPELAAQYNPAPSKCYAGANSGFVNSSGEIRSKTGDPGTSRLTAWSLSQVVALPSQDGQRFTFALTPLLLDSGQAQSKPYLGSYYRVSAGIGTQRNDVIDHGQYLAPSLGWTQEGPIRLAAELGLSPLNGPVFPLPTFSLAAATDDWRLNVSQRPVTESMLSWVGQRDPYTGRTWGRVLSVGPDASYTFIPFPAWFLSLNASGRYLYGEQVQDNWSVEGNISAGRSFQLGDNNLDLGVFATGKHFEQNANHFTFGQGGYYSPDKLFIAGPFARFRTAPCKSWYFDTEGSVGYFTDANASSPKYPLLSVNPLGMSQSGLTEALGRYPATSSQKLSYHFKAMAETLLSPYLSGAILFEVNNAADYTESRAMLQLRIFWEKQQSVRQLN